MNTGLWKMDTGLAAAPRPGMTFLRGLAGTNRRYGGLALAAENSYIYRTRSGQIPDAGNGC
jgi:hypothetical protein